MGAYTMNNGQLTVNNVRTTSKFQLVDTDKLIPYVNNARTHSTEQINKLRLCVNLVLSIL